MYYYYRNIIRLSSLKIKHYYYYFLSVCVLFYDRVATFGGTRKDNISIGAIDSIFTLVSWAINFYAAEERAESFFATGNLTFAPLGLTTTTCKEKTCIMRVRRRARRKRVSRRSTAVAGHRVDRRTTAGKPAALRENGTSKG